MWGFRGFRSRGEGIRNQGFGIEGFGDLRELPGTDVEQPTGLLAVLRGGGVLIGGLSYRFFPFINSSMLSARAAMRSHFVKVSWLLSAMISFRRDDGTGSMSSNSSKIEAGFSLSPRIRYLFPSLHISHPRFLRFSDCADFPMYPPNILADNIPLLHTDNWGDSMIFHVLTHLEYQDSLPWMIARK